MNRYIIIEGATGDECIKIPEGAKVTITENCNTCYFVIWGCSGNKLSCGHPAILAKRPYANGTGNELTRSVSPNSIPDWCLL